jgi:hypothetical protein
MKTIYVEPASIEINGSSIGTVTKVTLSGNCELFATQVNVWVNMISTSTSFANKSLVVTEGITPAGVNWAAVEADVLEQLGLTKSENQTEPTPVAP